MENYVSAQLLTFLQSILLGFVAGPLYDFLRAFRLRLPRVTAASDILYCTSVSLAVFLFSSHRAQGLFRL